MRLREREWCTSHEAWEDGDKRYPGNEVDLEHNDYDVMCLDKMQYDKLLFYISLSFCFWVRSRFCFVFLVWGFEFPFRDYLSVSSFGFSILLVCFFFRVLHVYFRVLSACFALRASRKTFSFLHCIILFCILWFWFLCFRFGIYVSVFGSGFPFYVFSLSATIYLTAVCL